MKKIILKIYLLSVAFLVAFYLIPGYLMLYGNWPEELIVMKGPSYYSSAMVYIWLIILSYSFFFIFGLSLLKENKFLPDKNNIYSYINLISIIFLFFGFGVIIYAIDFKDFISAETRFFSEHNSLLNLSSALFLIVFVSNLLVLEKNIYNKTYIVLSCVGFLVYPVAHSSRAAAIPFVVISLYQLFYQSSWKKFLLYGYLAAVFLGSSLYTRDELGLINYLNNLFYIATNPQIIIEKLMWIMPGLGSTSLAMQMMGENWNFTGGLGNFTLYISPIPSNFLPDEYWELGYSTYLNVTYMGLNSDFISEWIWWFGFFGCFVAGLFTSFITLLPLILAQFFKIDKNFFVIFGIFGLYFLMAGTSMSLRSSSRYLIYVVIIFLMVKFLKNFLADEKKEKNYNL
jgi:hypothetical protein